MATAKGRAGLPGAVRGALWMVGALLSFSLMAVAVRELLATLGSFQILFLRSAVQFAMLLVFLPRAGGLRAMRTPLFGLHVVRNLFHFAGQYAWVYAIALLPLATVFAIEFTMPVWTAILAAVFLRERMNRGRVVMLVTGLAGILIILKPGIETVQPAAIIMLAGAFAYAATMICTKTLATKDTMFAVLFYMSAVQIPLSLVLALPEWMAPGLPESPWIFAVGAAGLLAHYCMTRAVRLADVTVVTPIDFLRLPLIAIVGVLFYAEPLEPSILIGAAVIFAGTYYSLRREAGKSGQGKG